MSAAGWRRRRGGENREGDTHALGKIKRAERTGWGGWVGVRTTESGDTELRHVFAATNGCSCVVSISLNWLPV